MSSMNGRFYTEDVTLSTTSAEPIITSSDMKKPVTEVDGNLSSEALAGIVIGSGVGLLLLSLAIILVACRLRNIVFSPNQSGFDTDQIGAGFNSRATERSVVAAPSIKLYATNNGLPLSVPTIRIEQVFEKNLSEITVPAETYVKFSSVSSTDQVSEVLKPKSRDGWHRLQDGSADSPSLNGLDNPMFQLQSSDDIEIPRATTSSDTPYDHPFLDLSPSGRPSSPSYRRSPSGTFVEWSPNDPALPSGTVEWSSRGLPSSEAFRSVAGCVRRSYRLDGVSALAIAVQRNRDSSVHYDSLDRPDGANETPDVIIFYNERTAL